MAVDFTKQMKRDFTILAPDIFPTHIELLQEVFALHGYHVEVLHDEGPAVIAAGLKYLHNDMCYPATCAVGQQLYALTRGKYDPHRVALISSKREAAAGRRTTLAAAGSSSCATSAQRSSPKTASARLRRNSAQACATSGRITQECTRQQNTLPKALTIFTSCSWCPSAAA